MSISRDLLNVLACPKCKGEISLSKNEDGLLCESCRLIYPIREGIPVMLIDEAANVEGNSG